MRRDLAVALGVALALGLCVAAVGLAALGFISRPIAEPPAPPPASGFFGAWCSPRGDRLVLTDGRFTIDPMSPVFAGQISHRVTTPGPGGQRRWDDPPPTAAAGSWDADLLTDELMTIDIEVERLDSDVVSSEWMGLDIYEDDTGWTLYLRSGDLAFTRCQERGRRLR
ncbi:hypothetical protein FHR83_008859 [Actinoplanes campanulatus]|uniref:Uncharacterized protein n=1 Tax=Actinoplanes campanulatus TaxID=113559 RepID=A0A7W5ARK0_9ACTN|nr:hypothetical protein [Actinoplanes campanulatus]MBB3101131.1 hypothetical protein [Actinoplanes campanulatus]GGN51609.1 hypothetical protein GCM10010109_91870 [Actinoplanes campanulatus]GID42575.1 hypothetical protein Aca09nite_90810 [Actinoplanes campanulatus]